MPLRKKNSTSPAQPLYTEEEIMVQRGGHRILINLQRESNYHFQHLFRSLEIYTKGEC